MDQNEAQGELHKVAGKAKAAVGDVMGDTKIQTEGRVDEIKGAVQSTIGAVKDAVASETPVQSTYEVVREAIDRVSPQAQAMARDAQAMARDAGERIQTAARQVQQQMGDVGGQLYSQGTRAVDVVGQGVRTQPLTSLFIAGAIGYALALVLNRR